MNQIYNETNIFYNTIFIFLKIYMEMSDFRFKLKFGLVFKSIGKLVNFV